MKLIIMLICLGLERYGQWGTKISSQWRWFDPYVAWLEKQFGKAIEIRGWQGIAIIVLPVLVIVGFIHGLFYHSLYGAIDIAIGLVILLYCLGRPQTTTVESAPAMLCEANEQFFAVLFWFVVLGPVGALLYRMISWLRQKAEFESMALTIQGVLDWIPVRLVGLGYALMGNFGETITYWMENIMTGLRNSRQFLTECGKLAIGLQSAGQAEQAAQTLIDRTLILFVAVIAVFVLGSLL